jgi:large subunit ribosomal protein L30
MATSKKKTTRKTGTSKKKTSAASKKTGASKKTAKKAASKKTTSKKVTKKAAASKKTGQKTAAQEPAPRPARKVAAKKAAAPTGKTAADLERVGRAGRNALPRRKLRPRVVGPAVRARKEALAQRQNHTGPVVRIQYYRSAIGLDKKQKSIVAGLGLRRLNAVRVLSDTPALRGMIAKVPHLVRVLEDADA